MRKRGRDMKREEDERQKHGDKRQGRGKIRDEK
jgi:hypothetical protein